MRAQTHPREVDLNGSARSRCKGFMDLVNPPDASRVLDGMMAGVGNENRFDLLVRVNRMRVDEVLVLVLDTLIRSGARWLGGFRAECL